MSAQVKKLQWKKGSDAWRSWDYIAGTGDAGGPVTMGWTYNSAGRYFDGIWGTWQCPNNNWQLIVTVHFMTGMMPPTYQDADSDTLSAAVSNTVVTSETDVLHHHVNDTHTINWHIGHRAVTGTPFASTLTISTMAGGVVRTLTPAQTGTGDCSTTWDGKNTMGVDAGAGVYAYKVSATDVGGDPCRDQDKSQRLTATLSGSKFYWITKDTQAGTLKVIAKYTLADVYGAASNCAIRFYGPDLTLLATLDNQDGTIGTHWSASADISALDGGGGIVSPLYCVASAAEGTASAALNGGGDTKVALQRGGTTLERIGIISPPDGWKAAFSPSAPTGTCTVSVPGAPSDGGLQWTLDDIDGSTLTSNPANAQGANVTFTYTTLPSSNAAFGGKTLGLLCDTPWIGQHETIRVFFNKTATNHPDPTYGRYQGSTAIAPNWYYYWSQTSASYGTYYYLGPGRSYTTYWGNEWRVFMCDAASERVDCWGGVDGIDCFAWVCRHEAEHVLNLAWWWGQHNEYNVTDTDGDAIPDYIEDNAESLLGRKYLTNTRCTFVDDFGYNDPDGYGMIPDGEDYCLRHQTGWTNGTADSADWAAPGKQF